MGGNKWIVITYRGGGGGGGGGGEDDRPMTNLTARASSYVTTAREAPRTRLDLSTTLCQRGEGAARRLLLDFSGWASNPEDSAAMILL